MTNETHHLPVQKNRISYDRSLFHFRNEREVHKIIKRLSQRIFGRGEEYWVLFIRRVSRKNDRHQSIEKNDRGWVFDLSIQLNDEIFY